MSNENSTHLISITCDCGYSPQEHSVKAISPEEKTAGVIGLTLEEWITTYSNPSTPHRPVNTTISCKLSVDAIKIID